MIRLGATPVTARIAGNRTRTIVGAGLVVVPPDDTTAPVLTSPTGTATGPTTISASVTTNEGDGTLYAYPSDSATPPSAPTVKTSSFTQAITTTGAKTLAITGQTAGTTYYVHFLHRDAAGNDSAIVSSAAFETDAQTGFAYLWPAAIDESSDEDGFRYQVRTPAGAGAYTTKLTRGAESGTGGTLVPVTTYHEEYDTEFGARIIAFEGETESPTNYDEFIFRTGPNGTVSDLASAAQSSSVLRLTWSSNTPPTWGGYYVQQLTLPSTWNTVATVLTTDGVETAGVWNFEYDVTELPSDTAQSFRLLPFNSNPDIVGSEGAVTRPDSLGEFSNTATESTEVSPYFWQYDFDGGEGDYSNWTLDNAEGDTINFADTTTIHAGNRLLLFEQGAASWASATPPTIANADNKYFFFAYQAQGGEQILLGMGQLAIWLGGFGVSRALVIRLNYSTVLGYTGEIAPVNIPLYYWIHWRKSTGVSDGLLEVVFSAATTRPGTLDATNSLTVAHNVTDELPEVLFGKIAGAGGQYVSVDYLRGSFLPIGSNPP